MDTKQERGLNYRTINGMDEFVDFSPMIRMLIKQYLQQVPDKYTADDIMNIMSMGIAAKTFFIALADDDGVGVGIMTAHALDHGDAQQGAMIHIGFVDPTLNKMESEDIINKAMNSLNDWAKCLGMDTIFAQTQRNEKPFDKLLMKHGWKRYTTVYEKGIDHGKSETGGTTTIRPVEAGVPATI